MRGLARGMAGGVAVIIATLALAVPAGAQAPVEPPGRKSDNVTWKATLPEPNAVSARFSEDGQYMYLSTLNGLSVYDVSNAEAPSLEGKLPLPHFENEDVDISVGKDFVLISNDPSEGKGILYVISVADPSAPTPLGVMETGVVGAADFNNFFEFLPNGLFSYGTGHTASCVEGPLDDCQYAYLAGTSDGIDVVDLTDPANPKYATPRNLPVPEATGGLATHDVQFDRAGHALIVGAGGTAIYDVTNPLAPVLLANTDASGKSDYGTDFGADGSTLNDLIHHNSHRLPNSSVQGAVGPPNGDSDVMVVTEEDYQRPTCEGAGSLQTWRIGADNVIRNLDRWDVEEDPALSRDNALCSAHYFDEDAGLLAQGWYEQGTRFFDVTNPADIRQVGYWIPQKNVTWGAVFHPADKETVYALDHSRGVDVLHVERFGAPPAPTVTPPPDTSGETAPDNCASRPPTNAAGGCKTPPDQAAEHPGRRRAGAPPARARPGGPP